MLVALLCVIWSFTVLFMPDLTDTNHGHRHHTVNMNGMKAVCMVSLTTTNWTVAWSNELNKNKNVKIHKPHIQTEIYGNEKRRCEEQQWRNMCVTNQRDSTSSPCGYYVCCVVCYRSVSLTQCMFSVMRKFCSVCFLSLCVVFAYAGPRLFTVKSNSCRCISLVV